MNPLRLAVAFGLMAFNCFSQQREIGLDWEKQVRSWVPGISGEREPVVLIRVFLGGESREELFALYERPNGGLKVSYSKTREINAQAFSNLFALELKQAVPPIPIELKSGDVRGAQAGRFIKDSELFLKECPKTWELLAQMGHGGSISVWANGRNWDYLGPMDGRGGHAVDRILTLVQGIRRSLVAVKPTQVYEFPNVKELSQWRFYRAVLQGDEGLAIYLLSLGADPNKDSRFPESPIEQAINGGHKALLEALLKHGADPNALTSEGNTPLELAKSRKLGWAVQLITRFDKASH